MLHDLDLARAQRQFHRAAAASELTPTTVLKTALVEHPRARAVCVCVIDEHGDVQYLAGGSDLNQRRQLIDLLEQVKHAVLG